VRALGSHIKGTNGKSQGVVPFLKVVNDTAVAVNQGGKRKGAVCAYLETWHLDIEEFLELRKNTGDDRRRTHDMNTANWIPDLFMKRVMEGGDWTLFSPSTCPDLHDKFGADFEKAYTAYEAKADRGEIKPSSKTVPATDLWRKMLSMLFETGHPWITFKDACNVRSPQQHVGVVHSSNLCTEITLNTSDTETAVCNLGSVNLAQHLRTVRRAGDRPGQAEEDRRHGDAHARQRDRHQLLRGEEGARQQPAPPPGGAGHHGLPGRAVPVAPALRLAEAVEFRRPLDGSRLLPRLLGVAPSWPPSAAATPATAARCGTAASCRRTRWTCWRAERGGYVEVDRSSTLDWDALRARIGEHGMRNSNCVAIAPTATISNIIGVDASIEPCFGNLSVKSNLSGEFTVINELPGARPEEAGSVGRRDGDGPQALRRLAAPIDRVPQEIKACTPPPSRSSPRGWSKPGRGARSGSTRRSRSTSTWPAPRARSSTRPTSSPGCAA
jgi:ribonucleoside-diphosphate reductase alpha chain